MNYKFRMKNYMFSPFLILEEVIFEVTIMATISLASFNNDFTSSAFNILLSIIISNQNAVSSASSITTPSLAINSLFDLARQTAR